MAKTLNYFASGETQGLEKCTSVLGSPNVNTTYGRGGRYSYVLSADPERITFSPFQEGQASAGNDYIVGFYFYNVAGVAPATGASFKLEATAGGTYTVVELEWQGTTGDLLVKDETGSTVQTITAPFSSTPQAYRIEIYVVASALSGEIEVFIEGTSQGNNTGLDTLAAGGPWEDVTFLDDFNASRPTEFSIQDIYVLSGCTARSDRLSGSSGNDNWEVIPYYGDTSSTTGGTALDYGTWDDAQQAPFVDSAGNYIMYQGPGTPQEGYIEADGTGSWTGPSGDTLGTILGMGAIWRAAKSIPAMPIEHLAPSSIITQTNLTGSVTDIDDDPQSPDGTWLTATGISLLQVAFPSPSKDLKTTAGAQTFYVLLRKSATGPGGSGNVRLAPDTLITQTNLTGSVTDIQDDPDSPDSNWLTTGGNGDTTCEVNFPDATDDLASGAGLQQIKIWIRRTNNSANNPTATIDIYEGGTLVTNLATDVSITSTTGQLLTYTWDSADLTDETASSDVRVRIVTAKTGGSPASRNSGEIGAIEWNCEYAITEETPGYKIELYEAGTLISAAGSTTGTLSDTDGDTVAWLLWNAAELSDVSGVDVECRITQTDGTATRYIEVGAVEWEAQPASLPSTHDFVWGNDVDGSSYITGSVLTTANKNFQAITESTSIVPTGSEYIRTGMRRTGGDEWTVMRDMQGCILNHVLDAVGAITATPDLTYSLAAALKALGKLDGTPDLILSLTADLQGLTAPSPITATPSLALSTTADLFGRGKLDGTPDLIFSATANLRGTGKFSSTPDLVFSATADLDADGTLNSTPDLIFSLTADLIGVGYLNASLPLVFSATADLVNSTPIGLVATPDLIISTAADIKAKGKLDGSPDLALSIAANMRGIGKLDAATSMIFSVANPALVGRGVLDALPALTLVTAADLKADAALTSNVSLALSIAADLNDATPVGLNATSSLVFSSVADLKAYASLNATAPLILSLTADLNAQGKLDSTATTLLLSAVADLKSIGKLDANSVLLFAATADLLGTGDLNATAAMLLSVAANISSLDALTASADLLFSAAANIRGSGKLDTSIAMLFDATADLTSSSKIDASPALSLALIADLQGSGKLDATATLLLDATAALIAKGKLDASTGLSLSTTADLTHRVSISSVASLLFAASAGLVGIGQISATAPLIFGGAGDLKGSGKLETTAQLIFSSLAYLTDHEAAIFAHIAICTAIRQIAINSTKIRITIEASTREINIEALQKETTCP